MVSHYTTLLLAGILALGARAAFASPAPASTEPTTILEASGPSGDGPLSECECGWEWDTLYCR